MSGEGFHHRSLFKRPNKPFKGKSRQRSDRDVAGKVGAQQCINSSHTSVKKAANSSLDVGKAKWNRLNHAKQIQRNKREEHIAKAKLKIGSRHGPSKILALVSISPHANPLQLIDLLKEKAVSSGGNVVVVCVVCSV